MSVSNLKACILICFMQHVFLMNTCGNPRPSRMSILSKESTLPKTDLEALSPAVAGGKEPGFGGMFGAFCPLRPKDGICGRNAILLLCGRKLCRYIFFRLFGCLP